MYKQQVQKRSKPQTISDIELINIWLQQIPPINKSFHLYIAQMFLKFVKKPLKKVTQVDVIAFANIQGIRSNNRELDRNKRLETINSLLKFGQQTGILPNTQKKILSPTIKNFNKSAPSKNKTENNSTTRKIQKQPLNWFKLLNIQLASTLLIIFVLLMAILKLFQEVGGGANAGDENWPETVAIMPEIEPTENWAYPINVPRIRAFLDTIAVTEGTTGPQGYYRQYTNDHFSGFEDHPREMKCGIDRNNEKLCSDAAGRYQFLSTSWDLYAPMVGAKNFGPTYQDRVAIELIREKDALEDIEQGRIEEAFRKLYMVWPSFGETPTEVERLMPKLIGTYNNNLARYQPSEISSEQESQM
ncbi:MULTISPECIES: glycoside hydrolase family 104 protein [Okeania]|uniref:Glycoside hydrolase family 24 n=1 Tax=Okeania hirsuta TaxID=1458930 RepID=A0A3N6PB73_9CYAN|nr:MULTISPECIES: glycoside hydrolase family 104 protein [Okeania]NES91905.1 glycoside hydrolase family 24 [Okeania sp. SIO2B9]NET77525.1 glycoside hydrolase family 24 [Okeania sp. SIO1F9]RQH39606.1 glycoside hydrolase family 24 [Okeania hirsuta]